MKNPELYRLWYELPLKAPEGAASIIRCRFGAQYVLLNSEPQLVERLRKEPGVKILLITDRWVLMYLGESEIP